MAVSQGFQAFILDLLGPLDLCAADCDHQRNRDRKLHQRFGSCAASG